AGKEVEKLWMKERFSAEDPKKAVSVCLRLVDHSIERLDLDLYLRLIDIHPAALASQIAAVQNGEVKEGGKILALLETFLMSLDGPGAFVPEVPGHFHQEALVSGAQDSCGELKNHGRENS